jgi:peptidoglycan/xylan/chitin deacetylase (PgdA/CDA1 family)
MSEEGHEVGNRGYTGRAFSAIPANTIMSNVMGTSHIIHNITGKQNTKY